MRTVPGRVGRAKVLGAFAEDAGALRLRVAVRPRASAEIKRAGVKAKLNKRVTPHVLRHSFAKHLIKAG